VDEEFEDVELEGFDLTTQTLHCANTVYNQVIQVTTSSLRLIKRNCMDSDQTELVKEWKLPAGEFISVATSSRSECLIACRNQLYYFVIGNGEFDLTT